MYLSKILRGSLIMIENSAARPDDPS